MKFKELEIGQKFKLENVVFEKVKEYKGSCCTPKHNAVYLAPSDSIRCVLISEKEEVEQFDGDMPVSDIILKDSVHLKSRKRKVQKIAKKKATVKRQKKQNKQSVVRDKYNKNGPQPRRPNEKT